MLGIDDIGIAIRNRRKERGLSQMDLAKAAAVSRARIAGLEAGHLPEIGFKTALRLLAALDLDLQIISSRNVRPTLDDLRREQRK